jgi:diaminohydroxyphosphoribosylaminopyrimidine deaminase / 5-amino-6-(5-phosphoribosylamino)uracil reductase
MNSTPWSDFDLDCMRRALALAARGEGSAEPNPMVGCVLAREGQIIGEGWHERFGGPHAEVAAIHSADPAKTRGATAYVTLEPCCHRGRTPPCTEALLAAGIARVVAAQVDPFPRVAGGGFEQLRAAGVQVEVGCLAVEAADLNAPYLKLLGRKRPWVIAKWAMSLDGKIATRSGHSQWISGEASREAVHRLRGRVDAIVIGGRTAAADDPLLTARPPGARVAVRVVVDSEASLSLNSRLVKTAREIPVLVSAGPDAQALHIERLERAGCEVLRLPAATRFERTLQLLDELGCRQMTNVLVEGGSQLLGSLHDAHEIDEVHVFLAPKLVGGQRATTPIAGRGLDRIPELASLRSWHVERLGDDVHIYGRLRILDSDF